MPLKYFARGETHETLLKKLQIDEPLHFPPREVVSFKGVSEILLKFCLKRISVEILPSFLVGRPQDFIGGNIPAIS